MKLYKDYYDGWTLELYESEFWSVHLKLKWRWYYWNFNSEWYWYRGPLYISRHY